MSPYRPKITSKPEKIPDNCAGVREPACETNRFLSREIT